MHILTTTMSLYSFAPELAHEFSGFFGKCVRGYHLLNLDPIKESVWETINTQVLTHSGCTVFSQASGSHSPGSDISSSVGNFSNKSVKYESPLHNHINISSYRLTVACSAGNPGNVSEIIAEINKKKNFQYYSIIARDESPEVIHYDWIVLPADHPTVNPASYTWMPMIGKRGKNKDAQIGWQTDVINGSSMSITFSMSSQLWMSVSITEEMKHNFTVASAQAKKKTIMDYVQLADNYPEIVEVSAVV
jgi:hypothetical protein